jgi:hypothetical protein
MTNSAKSKEPPQTYGRLQIWPWRQGRGGGGARVEEGPGRRGLTGEIGVGNGHEQPRRQQSPVKDGKELALGLSDRRNSGQR